MTSKKSSISPNRDVNSDAARRDDAIDLSKGGLYEIKVEGQLDAHWSHWLGDLTINHDSEGNTLLTGLIPDQSALHGILVQIHNIGLVLISVKRIRRINC